MQFNFFFSPSQQILTSKKLWNYHDKFVYVCLSNFKIRYIFLLFFCLGCNNFCYCYIFFFVFSKIFKLIFVVYLVKKIIFSSNFVFGNFYRMNVYLLWMSVYRYIFWCNFFYIIHYRKNKNKTFFGKSDLPLFSIFLINFLWSSNPWRSLEYSQNGQKNKYLGNNFALWYFFFSRKHT